MSAAATVKESLTVRDDLERYIARWRRSALPLDKRSTLCYHLLMTTIQTEVELASLADLRRVRGGLSQSAVALYAPKGPRGGAVTPSSLCLYERGEYPASDDFTDRVVTAYTRACRVDPATVRALLPERYRKEAA